MDMEVSKCKRSLSEFSEEKQGRKRMRKRCLEVKKNRKKKKKPEETHIRMTD